ncbi:hypothetical protein FUA23_18885 [Neolewinella aurantiaca]|uniref:DUF3868 domain-containing protein n=1 Tax=Neolewinella aurantiaca TaxID=2602767 RepID=A0A5C7F8M2_9BACT|nr:hypothetical protein [Neolewinella aurantiaca]TXF87061.1 hypothetical protein FUA23_18885 [Neolewinella aurantiaca]
MKRFFLTSLYSLLISCAVFASGAGKSGSSLFDHWMTDSNTSIELHVNFDSLEVYRKKVDFMPAKVVQDGEVLDLEVAVRGKFRRSACAMPPLKLKFAKDGLRAAGLNTHNDFKLVTHCTNDEAGQDALLREQLAYELYRTVNPAASFRTQLLTITYVNTVDGSTTTSYAILIEDVDEMKNRIEAETCSDCYNMPIVNVDNAEVVTLFQYMIGNADYSTRMIRNLKMVTTPDGQNTFVPYDFDYTGLVNASYAKGMPHLGQTKITDRVLVWEFSDAPDFGDAADYLVSLKDTLLNQVVNFDGLAEASKKEMTKYLKSGLRQIKNGAFEIISK